MYRGSCGEIEDLAAFQKAVGVATRSFMFSMGRRVAEFGKHCIRAFDLAKTKKGRKEIRLEFSSLSSFV